MATTTSKALAKQENIVTRARRFLRGSWVELKKVHWPTREELFTYTVVVIIMVLVFMGAIWLLDSLFSYLVGLVL
ncbi:MAG: preprotein translocase subunit SecE [Clostridia bacterium]|nr:MAG: preprotein translocase subunit SecE [Clostridia bacterium]